MVAQVVMLIKGPVACFVDSLNFSVYFYYSHLLPCAVTHI